MNPFTALLLVTTLTTPPPTTLVLKTGDRIDVSGPIREEHRRVIFRTAAGTLYSIPLEEVDIEATRVAVPAVLAQKPQDDRMKLKVSEAERDRLLRNLEQNHSGTPSNPERNLEVHPSREITETPTDKANSDEWRWRREARAHDDEVRRAQEELDLINDRIEQLQQQIHGFLSLGYKPQQFTYQTRELEVARAQLSRAALELTRAKRANDEFRDDARRMGVLPGWLR